MTSGAYVSCNDIIDTVKQEITISRSTLVRLIALLQNDTFGRMQMWIADANRSRDIVWTIPHTFVQSVDMIRASASTAS
jgi:hypothetical protein